MPLINKRRPNTGVEDIFLNRDVILCCGEDWNELLLALGSITTEPVLLEHEYRVYRIALFKKFSLIWSGMGTGCLEPLLYEISDIRHVRNIILIGTAGAPSSERVKLGEIYAIEKAYLGGTAIHLPGAPNPLAPRFSEDVIAKAHLLRASIASTDYYYGFSKSRDTQELRVADPSLKEAVDSLHDQVALIDMETAQFYYFCGIFFPEHLRYIALKGAANLLADPTLQTTNSIGVLKKALAASFVLLDLPQEDGEAGPRPDLLTTVGLEEKATAKVMEEVKLYWTIQIAVCGVLGYLGTNLTLSRPSAHLSPTIGELDPIYLKNLSLAIVSFFLIQIGALYNLIGNYYARIAALGSRLAYQQENRVTPILAFFYALLSAAIAALGTKTGIPNSGPGLVLLGSVVGVLVNFIICRGCVYPALAKSGDAYCIYARPLSIVYMVTLALTVAAALAYWLTR
jgi:Phosphorylase superfamily